ncbi:uncharacterized protein BDV17DRAFT_260981 [Aspergillus undulatus]|uniref:uncharacterized protein n=1 Tax=Aspergillus undulatus TaxID=1810928 RepID=UPI003CCD054D
MKLTAAITTGLLATSASAAFDKWAPWGKRDYSCINAYSGPTENSTLTTDLPLSIHFNRNSGRCDNDYYDQYPNGNYSLWLYNNPVRDLGFVNADYRVKIQDGISPDAKSVSFQLPEDLPEVEDDTVWYLRLDTYLPTAPQMPSFFNALGPFRIVR